MNEIRKHRVILSGGGTGGHIYPAVAVAEALTKRFGDNVELLFVGAEGKMEMDKIPALGYRIEGLPVAGLQRKLSLSNLTLPFKVMSSVRRAKTIIKEFDADVVVGFGGYASAPVLWAAQKMGLPTVIQEQNSFAGKTNKVLGRRAKAICVAYDGMERFFPAERVVFTGNPLRGNFSTFPPREEAIKHFGLDEGRKTVFVVGGSLGTRTLNNTLKRWADQVAEESDVQFIWQTGKYYEAEMREFMESHPAANIWTVAFIERMDYAYSVADVVVSRSGANTVSELCLAGKSVIFVPSPNVAEDHQTKNAQALVDKGAAMMVPDDRAVEEVVSTALALLRNETKRAGLERNIRALAIEDSADRVAKEVEKFFR